MQTIMPKSLTVKWLYCSTFWLIFFLAKFFSMFSIHRLNWQHVLCKNPKQSPDITTILTDHTCDLPDREHGIPISAMLPAPPNAANHPSSAIVV
jgi:hypothetical protein